MNKNINKTNWKPEPLAWLAGLIEGEGYIAKGKVFLRVRMTDWDVVQRCHDTFKVGYLRGPVEGNEKKKHKPMYEWTITRRQDFYELLSVLYPKLGLRRQERIRECFGKLGLRIPDQECEIKKPAKPPVFKCRKYTKKAS